jgi:phage protein D
MSNPTTIARTTPDITVNGTVLSDAWYAALRQVRVEKELCLVGRATLRFVDDGYKLSETPALTLGDKVNIDIHNDGPIFAGVVVGAALEQHQGASPELVITIDDKGYALGHGALILPHVKKSISDIVSTIASDIGASADCSLSGSPYEVVLQRSSNLDFLDMLVRRANAVWWVDDSKLVVCESGKKTNSVTLDGTETLKDVSVRASALRPAGITVSGWDPKQGQDVVGQSSTSQVTVTSSSNFVDAFAGRNSALVSKKSRVTYANPAVQDEATLVAKSVMSSMVAEGGIA